MYLLNILNDLAATNGRNDKIAILTKNKADETLKHICFLALDPRTQFYIKKIPDYTSNNERPVTIDWALDELGKFSSRALTGNAAIERLMYILASLSDQDAEVIKRVIQRDLKCGVNDSTVNKVWKNLIPEYPYMRCALPKAAKLDKWNWKKGIYSQIKADGMFVNINHDADGNVTLMSRSGSVMPNEPFSEIIKDIRNTNRNTQTHGELLVVRDREILPREIGNGILTSVLKGGAFGKNERAIALVWDQIPLGAESDSRAYSERYENLKDQVSDSYHTHMIETKIVYSLEEAMEHYNDALARGLEGTIIKNPEGVWKNTTSKDQVKMKLDIDVDLKIIGFMPGKGKNESTFGSITCETSDGELSVNVSGFKEKKEHGVLTREDIWGMREELLGTIMTVRSNNIMPPTKSSPKYSLFLPRFVEFRSDKTEADSMKRVQEQFDNAVKGV